MSLSEVVHWNEMLGMEVIKLCHEMNFNTVFFFEGGDSQNFIDSYELKVRLEHLLERMALVSQAADSERPSHVTDSLFIGGVLAARSINTLQLLGVTHVLCLCANELGQSEAQYPNLFEYKNFEVSDLTFHIFHHVEVSLSKDLLFLIKNFHLSELFSLFLQK